MIQPGAHHGGQSCHAGSRGDDDKENVNQTVIAKPLPRLNILPPSDPLHIVLFFRVRA